MIGFVARMGAADTSPPSGGYTADWSTAWGPEWSKVDASGTGSLSVSSGAGQITSGSAMNDCTFARLDTPSSFSNTSILVGLNSGDTNRQARVAFRWGGSTSGSNPTDSYKITNRRGLAGNLRLYKDVGGTETQLGSSFTSPTVPIWLRIEANGTAIKWKFWKKTDPEPGAWTSEVTDAAHSAGKIGLGCLVTTSGTQTETFTDLEITEL